MDPFLRVFGQRRGTDHAQCHLKLVEIVDGGVLLAAIVGETERTVEETGIGPVGWRRVCEAQIVRGEDILPECIARADLAFLVEERQVARKVHGPARRVVRRGRVPQQNTIRIVVVRIVEDVVLEQDRQRALLRRVFGKGGRRQIESGQGRQNGLNLQWNSPFWLKRKRGNRRPVPALSQGHSVRIPPADFIPRGRTVRGGIPDA